MRLAQMVGLIHGDPKRAKGQAAMGKVIEQHTQAIFEIRLAGPHTGAIGVLPLRQRIQAFRGMKDDRGADARAQPVAQRQDSRKHG